jgi:uncharacterized integral membrane protein
MKKNLTLIIFNAVAFLIFLLIIIWSKDKLSITAYFYETELEAKKPFLVLMMGFGLTGILIQFSFWCKKVFK